MEIEKACIYQDGRCHVCFEDGSALILHPGGQFTSVFSASGELIRQVTSCMTGVNKQKAIKSIQLFNALSHSPISILSEEIYAISSKESKLTTVHWTNPGFVSIIDKYTKEELRVVEIDPSKEQVSVIVKDKTGALTWKSLDGEVTITLNSLGLLLRVNFPFLLPHRKPQWTSESHNRVRLSYDYVRIEQIFSVRNYPPWIGGPFEILLKCFEGPLPQEPVLYEPSFNWDQSELATFLPVSVNGDVWKSDINPATNMFNYYNSKVSSYWENEFTLYTQDGSNVVVVHEDSSMLVNTQRFYTLMSPHTDAVKFTEETVPPLVRTPKGEISINRVVEICQTVNDLPVYAKEETAEDEEVFLDGVKVENEIEGVGLFTAYNDRSIRILFEDRTVVRINSDLSCTGISRTGEMSKFTLERPFGFEQYIPVCVEFYDWAFTPQSEKIRREEAKAEREQIVMSEISRNQRTLLEQPQDINLSTNLHQTSIRY